MIPGLDYIIKECGQYNKLAQKLLYEMYAPKMKGICMRYITDTDLVKDVVQEGFIKVFSNIKQYKGEGSFEGWIKRIFINTALNYIRINKKGIKHLNINDIDESNIPDTEKYNELEKGTPEESQFNSGKIDMETVLLANISEKELLAALQKVPEIYRVVFNMSCIENFKHEEIAEFLNIDTATSRTRLLRARGILKKELHAICLKKLKK